MDTAGADIVETNTFTATAASQGDYHLQPLVRELNLEELRGRFLLSATEDKSNAED